MGLTDVAQDMLKKGSETPYMVKLERGLRLMIMVNGNHQLSITRDNVYPSDSEVLLVRQAFGIETCRQEKLQRGKAHTIKLSWSIPKQTEEQANDYIKAEVKQLNQVAGEFFFEDGQTYRDRWGAVYMAMSSGKRAGRWLMWELNQSYIYDWYGKGVWQVQGYLIEGERVWFGNWSIGKGMFKATFGPILAEREVSDFSRCEVEWVKYELEY